MKINKTFYVSLCVLWLAASLHGIPVRVRSSTGMSRGSSSRRGSSSSSHKHGQSQKSGTGSGSGYSGSGYSQGSGSGHAGSSGNKKPSSWDSWVEKPKDTHSYPASKTGLSGGGHRSSAPNGNQQNHGYPASTGLSGQSGTGGTGGSAGYPQQQGGLSGSSGLSGNGAGHQQTGLSGGGTGSGYPSQQNVGHSAGMPHQHSAPGSGYPHPQGAAPPPYSAAGGVPPPYSPPGSGYQQHYGTGGRQNIGGTYPNNNYHQGQPPPPPYSSYGGSPGAYHPQGYGSQMPGYFGNSYGKGGFGGMSRGSSALTGVGIAGAGVGTLLTGLALWNLARSTGRQHHTVIYDNRGQPIAVAPGNTTIPEVDPMLADLVNCTLTVDNGKSVEILAIPCAIATSFSPEADVKDPGLSSNSTDSTKCIVTIVTKQEREFMTTIPCSTLLNTAAENNVTEPSIVESNPATVNETGVESNLAMVNETGLISPVLTPNLASVNDSVEAKPDLAPLLTDKIDVNRSMNCTPEPGDVRDPINPCFSLTSDVTVVPLQPQSSVNIQTPSAA